jgi:hypothetical protein
MNLAAEMTKSEMIRRSLRCLALGWWSLVPLVGIFTAPLAFADFRAVVAGKGRRWNAARWQLLFGAWLAGLGLMSTLVIGGLIALAIVAG